MGLGDIRDKFTSLFKITAFLFRPYVKLRYQSKNSKSMEDWLTKVFVYAGTWLSILVIYILFMYLTFYKDANGREGEFSDFYTIPPVDLYNELLKFILISPFFKITFLLMLFFAITFHAEKVYLESRVLHLDLSGLIKTLTLGKFDISSNVKEQNEGQVKIARSNIFNTVNDNTKELITIISASGWDLFGSPPPPQPQQQPATIAKKPNRFVSWCVRTFLGDTRTYEDGYLLEVVSQQFRKVQIVLLDPDGETVKKRAECYMKDGGHKPIKAADEYKKGIEAVIANIKIAYKKNKNIELKLIDKLPEWKMVIVEGEIWTQPIIQGVRSDHTPLYGFNKTEYSMYHSFWNISEAIWHHPDAKTQDLTK